MKRLKLKKRQNTHRVFIPEIKVISEKPKPVLPLKFISKVHEPKSNIVFVFDDRESD